jgi:hypothetical protein
MYELKVVCRVIQIIAMHGVSSCGEASRPHRCGRGDCRRTAAARLGAPRPGPPPFSIPIPIAGARPP